MNDLTIAVSGWVATDPKFHVGVNGASMCTFRLASTPRHFSRATGEWADGTTEWFTVRTFRGGAITVYESIKKGQPVVVTGRLRTNTWEASDGPRTDLQVDATAVGHDLTRGIGRFVRATGDEALGAEVPAEPNAEDAQEPVEPPSSWDMEEPDDALEEELAAAK